MQVFEEIAPLRALLSTFRANGKSVGLIPTMGALHQGHLSLIEAAKKENDLVVCSIFVNPAQFNDTSDLKNYPRTPQADFELLQSVGCDIVLHPSETAMYPTKPQLRIQFGALEKVMEGASREGHFQGVGLVVSKLFNIVQPDRAYFGQKDLQQFQIISQLVKDLDFPVNLICAPIVREPDGLAMSSRNTRLNMEERIQAANYYQALIQAAEMLHNGTSVQTIKDFVSSFVAPYQLLRLDYFEIVDRNNLQAISEWQPNNTALCIAGYAGNVRLIDNILI